MKIRSWAALCFFLSVGFTGCKGFWNPPPSSGGGGGGSSGIFYVLNEGTGQIVADSISSSGITNIGSSNITGPTAIAIAPNKNYLYVSTLAGIYVYNIGSNGALTLGNNNQVISYDLASAIVVDTGNAWLIDAFTNGGQVVLDAIPLNSTGTYTSGANVPSAAFTIANATVKQMALSSDDANVFVALGAGGTLVVPFDSSNPFPKGVTGHTIAVLHNQGSDLSVAVDPSTSPRLFYVGEVNGNSAGNSGGLRYFNYSTLAEVSGSPLASGGLAPNAILPLADYVYVANGQGQSAAGDIAWFPVTASGTSYSLSAGSSTPSGIQPMGLAEDSTGTYVLAVSAGYGTSVGGNPDVQAFTIGTSGALTSFKSATTGTDPVGAAAIAALP